MPCVSLPFQSPRSAHGCTHTVKALASPSVCRRHLTASWQDLTEVESPFRCITEKGPNCFPVLFSITSASWHLGEKQASELLMDMPLQELSGSGPCTAQGKKQLTNYKGHFVCSLHCLFTEVSFYLHSASSVEPLAVHPDDCLLAEGERSCPFWKKGLFTQAMPTPSSLR